MADNTTPGRRITLIDPLRGFSFQLPIPATFNFIHKAVLSANPVSDPYGFTIMVIYGENRQLAYYKSRKSSWKMLDEVGGMYYEDVIWHNGKFYAVDEYGKVMEFGIPQSPHNEPPSVRLIAERWSFDGNKVYIVGIGEALLVIFRKIAMGSTWRFNVFGLDPVNRSPPQVLGSFDGLAIFVGRNESTWTWRVDDDHENMMNNNGIIGDCIYFTDDCDDDDDMMMTMKKNDNGDHHHDVGCYSMEDESVYPLIMENHPSGVQSRGFWFTYPSFRV